MSESGGDVSAGRDIGRMTIFRWNFLMLQIINRSDCVTEVE
jgi:hypothetical protein